MPTSPLRPLGHDAGEGLIGDTIFLDRNANLTPDAGEGLEGVKVRLYAADGTTLVATTTTNENGQYFFGGLSPTGTYVVKVDTATLPAGLTNTVDPDGGTAHQATVNLATSGPTNLNQDFGYDGANTIAGTLWQDTDGDGLLDGGESGGWAGVTVALLDANGNIVATTTTDANGNFSFGNLPDGTFKVDVTDAQRAERAVCLQRDDAGGDDDHQREWPVLLRRPECDCDLRGQGRHGDAAGRVDQHGRSGRRHGAPGDRQPGDQRSDQPGPGLRLRWRQHHRGHALAGHGRRWPARRQRKWRLGRRDGGAAGCQRQHRGHHHHRRQRQLQLRQPAGRHVQGGRDRRRQRAERRLEIDRSDPGADNNSQAEPYTVTVSGGQTNTTADFGYYNAAAGLGNFVWNDANKNGLQDPGESGLGGVAVTLTITWPSGGGTTTVKTTTDANGFYSFGNLLLDENMDGAGAGEPTFTLAVATPATYAPTLANQGGNDALDSDPSGVTATTTEGTANTSYDFGFVQQVPDITPVITAVPNVMTGITHYRYLRAGDRVELGSAHATV